MMMGCGRVDRDMYVCVYDIDQIVLPICYL